MATIFADSAYKHGYTEQDYAQVVRHHPLQFRSRRGVTNGFELLGRNDAGDYLHIVLRKYWNQAEKVVIVFHINRMCEADRRLYLRKARK